MSYDHYGPDEPQTRPKYLFGEKLNSIVFIGPPGAGKGTHAKMLVNEYPDKFLHISTGDLFREMMKVDKDIEKIMKTPYLLSDTTTMDVFHTGITNLMKQGIGNMVTKYLILDGIPRTVTQAKLLEENFDIKKIAHIWVPDYQAIFRMTNRKDNRPENKTKEHAENRIKEYKEKTTPVLNYYQERNPDKFFQISNAEALQSAHRKIVKGLEEFIR